MMRGVYRTIRSEGYKHMNQGEYDLAIERFSDAIALDRKRATYYCDRRCGLASVFSAWSGEDATHSRMCA